MFKLGTIAAIASWGALGLPSSACGEAPKPIVGVEGNHAQAGQAEREGHAVSNLPYARERTFRTLDQYLAHLEQLGAIDLPYWREVAPGVYERVTTRMPRRAPERATRAELMERYGFRE